MRNELINAIFEIYQRYGKQNEFENFDREYLINAFHGIEQIWTENFNRLDQINYIVLSEAPLWGINESYIYNLNSPFTPFFYENDLCYGLNIELINNRNENIEEKKSRFLNTLINYGILILDVLPYALNFETALNYSRNTENSIKLNTEDYMSLLNVSLEYFIHEKLNEINERINPERTLNIIYRYRRLSNLHHVIGPRLNNSFGENNFQVYSIGIQGGGIDRTLLRNILNNQ
jgi:hypothetical protein